jgi:hypothetical protein
MNMGTNLKSGVIILVFVVGMVSIAAGRTIYVDDDGPADFNTIQAAIDDSNDGDTIIVADGIYTGEGNRDIDFLGKAITVRSTGGPRTCIINCQGQRWTEHRGFSFQNGEGPESVLSGLTITNGSTPGCGGFAGGGAILCVDSNPTITNCIIADNRASNGCVHPDSWGGGIFCYRADPTITNCIFAGNFASTRGGGISCRQSSPVIINCTFTENMGNAVCSGWESNFTLINCILWNNTPEQINLYDGTVTVTCSDIQGYWPGYGNIDADPCFTHPGYWDPNGSLDNFWDDFWVPGDYYLKSQAGRYNPTTQTWLYDYVTSPCIDAGDPMSPIGPEPFPNGGIINMGAYGGTDKASKSYFGGPVCEMIVAGDVNGDCIVNYLDFRLMALHWLRDEN